MGAYFATFVGGAADGQSLEFNRIPNFLRAVCGVDGKWDVLDQLEDDPGLGEEISIYRLEPGETGHICGRGRGGCTTMIRYHHTDLIAPDGMEDRERWRAAVTAVAKSLEGSQPDPVGSQPAGRDHLSVVDPDGTLRPLRRAS